jgi:hypothetical protein
MSGTAKYLWMNQGIKFIIGGCYIKGNMINNAKAMFTVVYIS